MKNKDWNLAGIFADRGITGTVATKRPEFMRMIKWCKQKKIDLIITKSVTRFARNTVDALEYARMLKDMGIGIIFEKEGLKSEKYAGNAILQKTFVADCISHRSKKNTGALPSYFIENSHPAIIEQGVWTRVQEELARRGGKRKVKEERGTKTEQGKYSSKFALTELLVCGECGTPYRRCTWSKNGKKKIVWRCISRIDYGTKYCAHSPTLDEGLVQAAILDAIMQSAQENTGIIEALKRHIGMGLSGDENGDDCCTLQARIGEIENTIGELILLEAQDGNHGKYDTQFEMLYAEKMELKAKLEQINSNSAHAETNRSRLTEIFTVVDGLKNCPLEWDEKIVRQMIECVRVQSKNKIAIRFRWGAELEAGLAE
jgi:hypothetical protein